MTSLTQQTAGRKGGKAPPKKTISRRRTIPYEQRQQRPSLVMSQTQYNTYITDESFNRFPISRSCRTFP